MTDDERLTQIQARNAARARGSETGVTMTQSQADVGFLLCQLADRDERLRACGILAEPLTCSSGDDSLTAYAIQHVAAGRKTPAEAIDELGEEWAGALDRPVEP